MTRRCCCGCVWIFHAPLKSLVFIFLFTVGQCSHPIHQATQNNSEYQQENIAGGFGRFFEGLLPTHLAVSLIPQKRDPYMLCLVINDVKHNTSLFNYRAKIMAFLRSLFEWQMCYIRADWCCHIAVKLISVKTRHSVTQFCYFGIYTLHIFDRVSFNLIIVLMMLSFCWCGAPSEKDLVMGMIKQALGGVEISGHNQHIQRIQALHPSVSAPPPHGPSFKPFWRKPQSKRFSLFDINQNLKEKNRVMF